jgi:hypothetical protein
MQKKSIILGSMLLLLLALILMPTETIPDIYLRNEISVKKYLEESPYLKISDVTITIRDSGVNIEYVSEASNEEQRNKDMEGVLGCYWGLAELTPLARANLLSDIGDLTAKFTNSNKSYQYYCKKSWVQDMIDENDQSVPALREKVMETLTPF